MGELMTCGNCGKPAVRMVNVAPDAASGGTMVPRCETCAPALPARTLYFASEQIIGGIRFGRGVYEIRRVSDVEPAVAL